MTRLGGDIFSENTDGFAIKDPTQAFEFDTILDMIASTINFPDKKKITVSGYFVAGDGGGGPLEWLSSGDKTEHDGILTFDPDVAFYTDGNQASVYNWYNGDSVPVGAGVFRRVFTGTVYDDWGGVLTNNAYVFFDAFVNRKLYEKLLLNLNHNDFTFTPKDELVWIVGSINAARNDMTIRHLAGCHIRGRYDDPVNHPGPMQAGGMLGFVHYFDPYPEGSNPLLTGEGVSNVNYILDGEASTEFNVVHSEAHNNNVLGFFTCVDCSVTGTGGISETDHNGVAFDGFCVNPNVDVAYIKNYDDRAVTLKGTPGLIGTGRINVGTLTGSTLAGSVKESILVKDYTHVSVTIGDAFLNVAATGYLVWSQETDTVDITCGYAENARAACRMVNSGSVILRSLKYKNIDSMVARDPAGVPLTFTHRSVVIKDVVCLGTENGAIYSSTYTEGPFKELTVEDCNFELATGTFTPYAGFLTASKPDIINFENNFAPKGDDGVHDGADNAAVLTDTTQSWTVDEHIGKTLKNINDGSKTTVTSNTATTITGVLAGGKENDWDIDDNYTFGAAWVQDSKIWNARPDRPGQAISSTIAVYDTAGAKNDNPYEVITLICTHSSSTHTIQIPINLRDLFLTSADSRATERADDGSIIEISTVRVGTTVTFTLTASAGTGVIVRYSLGN